MRLKLAKTTSASREISTRGRWVVSLNKSSISRRKMRIRELIVPKWMPSIKDLRISRIS